MWLYQREGGNSSLGDDCDVDNRFNTSKKIAKFHRERFHAKKHIFHARLRLESSIESETGGVLYIPSDQKTALQ